MEPAGAYWVCALYSKIEAGATDKVIKLGVLQLLWQQGKNCFVPLSLNSNTDCQERNNKRQRERLHFSLTVLNTNHTFI